MNLTYDVYGFAKGTIEEIAQALTQTLGVDFAARYSDFWGNYYKFGQSPNENLKLYPNYQVQEEEYTYPEWKNCSFILDVNRTARSSDIEEMIFDQLDLYNPFLIDRKAAAKTDDQDKALPSAKE